MLEVLLNAAALGAAYALLALGFVLVLNATSAVNFTQGDMVMAGGYVAVALATVLPAPGIVLLPFVLLAMIVLGLAFSLAAYFPLKTRPPVSVFISTIALGIIFQNTANAIFGAAPRGGSRLPRGSGLERREPPGRAPRAAVGPRQPGSTGERHRRRDRCGRGSHRALVDLGDLVGDARPRIPLGALPPGPAHRHQPLRLVGEQMKLLAERLRVGGGTRIPSTPLVTTSL